MISEGSSDMKEYCGEQLNNISYPLGGMGAGTICLTGWGGLESIAIRHHPDRFFAPGLFSAVTVLGDEPAARLLETEVPKALYYTSVPEAGRGTFATPKGRIYGLPRFREGCFSAQFPFACLRLSDPDFPVRAELRAWSPFIPGNADASSLPMAAIEYTLQNASDRPLELEYSFSAFQFLNGGGPIPTADGFILPDTTDGKTGFCVSADNSVTDCFWYRSGWWFDALTMQWNNVVSGIREGRPYPDPEKGVSPGASLGITMTLLPGEKKTVCLRLSWYIPDSDQRYGHEDRAYSDAERLALPKYRPWYATRFAGIRETADYWKRSYSVLRQETQRFSDALAASDIPEELSEAVSANLCVLKSPTILRQTDGRLWCWEGCNDTEGSCYGSCNHVWNYAQAICHLFPELERGLRETEFFNDQDDVTGHQHFRTSLPIRTPGHDFYAAADGQLGGIIKVYREWRICGDTQWLQRMWPRVKGSLEYCIGQWDPDRAGRLHLPHHNTFDIEFCGCDSLTTSFYISALAAAVEIARTVGDTEHDYEELYRKARQVMETELYNGSYFCQKPEPKPLTDDPFRPVFWAPPETLPSEVQRYMNSPIPPYQYGDGCLSDEVVGIWLGELAGLRDLIDSKKLESALEAVFHNNFSENFYGHTNPQRTGYAVADEPGLLLCSWPNGGKPPLPFVYSDEVWTGVEYQVASHLLMKGKTDIALKMVRSTRSRFTGKFRNPFSEYECGDWYARSLSSYALLEAYTGIRYDAVTQTLFASSRNSSSFSSFFACGDAYGIVTLDEGRLTYKPLHGDLVIKKYTVEDNPLL